MEEIVDLQLDGLEADGRLDIVADIVGENSGLLILLQIEVRRTPLVRLAIRVIGLCQHLSRGAYIHLLAGEGSLFEFLRVDLQHLLLLHDVKLTGQPYF